MSEQVADRDGFTINVNKFGDFSVPPFHEIEKHQEVFSNLPKLKCYNDDVIICGFPKCGTHWLWEICNKIIYGTVETVAESKTIAMLEACLTEDIASLPSPRLLNSHLPPSMLPVEIFQKKCKILFSVRDPRDVTVSYFHHVKITKISDYNGPWDNFLEMFLDGKVTYGSIFDYMEIWDIFLQENPEVPLLVVHYEDLKQNTVDGIKRIAEFLEIPLVENIVQAISARVDFKYIKTNEHLIYSKQLKKRMLKHKNSSFYRKGIVGDWKNQFTVAQSETFDARFQERMTKSRFLSRYA